MPHLVKEVDGQKVSKFFHPIDLKGAEADGWFQENHEEKKAEVEQKEEVPPFVSKKKPFAKAADADDSIAGAGA